MYYVKYRCQLVPWAAGLICTLLPNAGEIRVISRCSYTMAGAGGGPSGASSSFPIDSSFHESFGRVYEDLASRGERVLACAILHLDGNSYPEDYEFDEDDYPTTGERWSFGLSSSCLRNYMRCTVGVTV